MSYLSERILRLTKYFYPNGRAFRVPEGGVLERLHISLNKSEEAAYLDATGILNTIIPDNDLFTEEDALDWEVRLGITIREGVSLEDRKAAILRKMNHPNDKFERAHYLFIQKQLQIAGFKVWVYENRRPDGGGGFGVETLAHFVEEHYNPQFSGTFQHGQIQHGQSGLFNAFEKVVNFLTNEEDANVDVPNGRQTFFIGGDEPGKFANVLPQRETEFRKVILQLKPVESAALLAIRYGDGLYDSVFGSLTPIGGAIYLKIRQREDRVYVLDLTSQSVRVVDIATDSEIPGEQIGLGTIVNGTDFEILGDKIYIVDDDGSGEIVRVFDIITKAAIPGENFGLGVLDRPISIGIRNGEAYIGDRNTSTIHVFNISTLANVRNLAAGLIGVPRHVQIRDGVVYSTGLWNPTGNGGLHALDAQTGEYLPNKHKTFFSTQGFTIENGYLYYCDASGSRVEVFDTFTDNLDLTTRGFSAGGVTEISVSDNKLTWLFPSTTLNIRERNT